MTNKVPGYPEITLPDHLLSEDIDLEDFDLGDDQDLKRLALACYLEINPIEIDDGYDDHNFIINPGRKKWGNPPSHYVQLAKEIKEFLSERFDPMPETWSELLETFRQAYKNHIDMRMRDHEARESCVMSSHDIEVSEETRRIFMTQQTTIGQYAYNRLKDLMPLPENDPHKYVNGLYFILTGPGKHETDQTWHIYAIRAAFNGEEVKDIRPLSYVDDGQYMVLTDSEADDLAEEYISDSLWEFNASFLAGETDLPQEVFEGLSEKYEDGNDAILKLVEKTCGLSDLVETAVSLDGRPHFLNTYDGEENEVTGLNGEDLYIYRAN